MEIPNGSGSKLRLAVENEKPLQIVGVINAYTALLAEQAGFKALYLSGAGVANASFGLPDLGLTHLQDVCEDTRRITGITELPLLIDADTGWGDGVEVSKAVKAIIDAGAAGCHLEDQVHAKRCGHRPNKALVSQQDMCDRLKSAVDGRQNDSFVIMARTDAYANEGKTAAVERVQSYVQAGADMIFAEALQNLEDYKAFTDAVDVPVLANITEFGKTPMFTLDELNSVGVRLALYPLSAFRAMSQVSEQVFAAIRADGTQKNVMQLMQTREKLYEVLDYYKYEKELDTSLQPEKE